MTITTATEADSEVLLLGGEEPARCSGGESAPSRRCRARASEASKRLQALEKKLEASNEQIDD